MLIAYRLFYLIQEKQYFSKYIVFIPVLEQCGPGQKSFLCHHHMFELNLESFVPSIVGLNSGEGGMQVSCKFYKYFITSPVCRP